MPNLLTYNFELPNGEVKSSGPFRSAAQAAYCLLCVEDVEYVKDKHENKYLLSATQPGYVIKNGHLLKVI